MEFERFDKLADREAVAEGCQRAVERWWIFQALSAHLARRSGQCADRAMRLFQARQFRVARGTAQAVLAHGAAQQAGLGGQHACKECADVQKSVRQN